MRIYLIFLVGLVSGSGISKPGRYDICIGQFRAVTAFQASRIGTNIVKCIARTLHRYRPPAIIFHRFMGAYCVMVRFCRTIVPYGRTTTSQEIRNTTACCLNLLTSFSNLGSWDYYHLGDGLPDGEIMKQILTYKFYPEVLDCGNTMGDLDFQVTADVAVGILRFVYENLV